MHWHYFTLLTLAHGWLRSKQFKNIVHVRDGQFEGGKYLGLPSLSAARFEGTGLLQHGSYATGGEHTTKENSLVLEANTKSRTLCTAQVYELSCGELSYLYRLGNEKTSLMKVT